MKPISFTVVVPAYNAAAFLERAVRSVTEQRYPQCRVVIVNDGSADVTGRILRTKITTFCFWMRTTSFCPAAWRALPRC